VKRIYSDRGEKSRDILDILQAKEMLMKLTNKVAIITGSGSGIGQAAAVLFSKEGAKVVIVDCDKEKGEETVDIIRKRGGEVTFIPTDISKALDVKRVVNRTLQIYGKIDILVNNAGIYIKGDVVDTEEEDWDRIVSVNLRGAFLCSKYCILEMLKRRGGVIVNVASEAGVVAIRDQVAYNVSKSGLISLTKSTALDFADKNIRVNCICPGTTETPLFKAAVEKESDPVKARRLLEQARPLNRLGKPEEIAYGILFLASDEAAYITGSSLIEDGGYTAQ